MRLSSASRIFVHEPFGGNLSHKEIKFQLIRFHFPTYQVIGQCRLIIFFHSLCPQGHLVTIELRHLLASRLGYAAYRTTR